MRKPRWQTPMKHAQDFKSSSWPTRWWARKDNLEILCDLLRNKNIYANSLLKYFPTTQKGQGLKTFQALLALAAYLVKSD
jgi:hypothetical protein